MGKITVVYEILTRTNKRASIVTNILPNAE